MKDIHTINLIEHDIIFNNQVIVKIIKERTERNNLIPKEQHRSRKLYRAIHQVANKLLLHNMVH